MTATVLLVHGGCGGAWSWDRVVPRLQELGVDAVAVDLPSVGTDADKLGDLHADADHVRMVAAGLPAPVLLCGHSYGGAVITEAGAAHPHVGGLVYLAALMPDETESAASLLMAYPAPAPTFTEAMQAHADGTAAFDSDRLIDHFLRRGWDAVDAATLATRLAPQSLRGAVQSPAAVAWREQPSTFVACRDDEAISPELRALFSSRAAEVVELDGDHFPQWRCAETVAIILAHHARSMR